MKQFIRTTARQGSVFFKWVLFALIVGIVVGFAVSLFALCVEQVTALRNTYDWLIFLLPLGGMAIVRLYRRWGKEGVESANSILTAVRENTELPLRTAPMIFVSTLITHIFGGSAGRESAALQIGGSVSAAVGRRLKLDKRDLGIMIMCGMSAGFAAMFRTPVSSAMFSMEVVSVGVVYYAALVPCLLSALAGAQIAQLLGLDPAGYVLTGVADMSTFALAKVAGLGILFAMLSVLFCRLMHEVPQLYGRYLKNTLIRVVVGGTLVILMTLLSGSRDYNGAGGGVIARAISGEALPAAFLLKMLFTAVTLGAGYKGGEIIPAFFTGATFGCVAAPFLGLPASFGAGLGMISIFCGVTNCPVTSLLMALELFGGKGMPFFALSCGITYMLSGYCGLYGEQKIVYSKFKAELIDMTLSQAAKGVKLNK